MPDETSTLCNRCVKLGQEVEHLNVELTQRKKALDEALDKLTRVQRLYDKGTRYIEELHAEVRLLNSQISEYKQHEDDRRATVVTMFSVGEQTEPEETSMDQGKVDVPSSEESTETPSSSQTDIKSAWVTQPEAVEEGEIIPVETQSIAESLREAAEEAQQQSGFVYDESTGLYYNKESGYYYDGEKGLYYEPYSGTYYYFNTETNSYEFHSQADLSSFSEETSKRYFKCVTGEKQKKSKKNDSETKDDADDRARSEALLETLREQFKSAQQKGKKKRKKEKKKEKKRQERELSAEREDRASSKDMESQDDAEPSDDRHQKKYSERRRHRDRSRERMKRSRHERSRGHRSPSEDRHRRRKKKRKAKSQSNGGSPQQGDKMEEGELSSSSLSSGYGDRYHRDRWRQRRMRGWTPSSSSSSSDSEVSSDEGPRTEVVARNYPPCIRAIVTSSDVLDEGSLYIITYSGATLGREEELNHTIHIPDEQVSKMHCEIKFNKSTYRYVVCDRASQNGTMVNGHRLSEPKVVSAPQTLAHNDTLTLGGTTLQLHIHPGTETCDECEPGIVMAKIKEIQARQKDEEEATEKASGKNPNTEKLRKMQLRQIKKKYGLANTAYVDNKTAIDNPAYRDKAAQRRKTVGSDNPYQKDDAPASVHRSIPSKNKGHKLLAKMGWKEGDSLGKSQAGITEPIQVSIRANQAAGLGSYGSYSQSLDNVSEVQATEKWLKAQERYHKLQQQGAKDSTQLGQVKGQGTRAMQFEHGGVQNPQEERMDTEGLIPESRIKTEPNSETQSTGTGRTIKTEPQPVHVKTEPKPTIKMSWNTAQNSRKITFNSPGVSSAFRQDSSTDADGGP